MIEINDLYVEYKTDKGVLGGKQIIHAVNGVSLKINKGEILALAGESGCGKSTLAKAILNLVPPKSGCINIRSNKKLHQFAQMVFQNPYASLNPKMKIFDILKEPLEINTSLSREEIQKHVKEKIKLVGLDEDYLSLYPHEFSGGQRQRIAIARALMLEPEFILADEPVSALDVSIQAQIINLLKELKETQGITFLLITHDMSVIKYLADRTAVMYLGEIVEIGKTEDIFKTPLHPYTKALLNSVPQINHTGKKNFLKGDLPSPADLPSGCKFHTRCPKVMAKCKACTPCEKGGSHIVKCFLYE
jgi:oligopeptide/dipeptide ABC transporter ATP-binding protein